MKILKTLALSAAVIFFSGLTVSKSLCPGGLTSDEERVLELAIKGYPGSLKFALDYQIVSTTTCVYCGKETPLSTGRVDEEIYPCFNCTECGKLIRCRQNGCLKSFQLSNKRVSNVFKYCPFCRVELEK